MNILWSLPVLLKLMSTNLEVLCKRKQFLTIKWFFLLNQNPSVTQGTLGQQRLEQSPRLHVQDGHQTRKLCTRKYGVSGHTSGYFVHTFMTSFTYCRSSPISNIFLTCWISSLVICLELCRTTILPLPFLI